MRFRRLASVLLLSLSLFVIFSSQFSVNAYAADVNDTVFLAPTSQTSIYFNSSISDGSILLTCKSTVTTATPWEIVISPPLSYAESDGDYYITFVNYRSYNPDVIFYNANGVVINALSTKQINIDSVSYDTNAFVYKLPKTLAYIKVGGGGSGTLSVNQTVFMSAYFQPADSEQSNDDIIAAIQNQTNSLIAESQNQTNEIKDKIDEVLTPEGEHNLDAAVENSIGQVLENLGALGFAVDTIEQFIGLFNEEPPAPVITVPPLKIKIQGVEHQFFDGYQYDFRSLENGGLSVLVYAVRFTGTIVLWWAFLQYCLKESDQFFRR